MRVWEVSILETALLISATVGAVSSVANAQAANVALNNDIARYKDEKKYAELRALQDENARRRVMDETLAANRAIAGAAGILDDSRSFLSIQEDVVSNAVKDIQSIRLNAKIANSKYDQAIINSKIEKQPKLLVLLSACWVENTLMSWNIDSPWAILASCKHTK